MATLEELHKRIETLEGMQAEARTIYQVSHRLNGVRDEVELLKILAQPSVDTHFAWSALSYIHQDEADKSGWVEVAAVWPERGGAPLALGARYRLDEFPLVQEWLASPDKPRLFANVVKDPTVDEASRKLMEQSGTWALALIPSVQDKRWGGIVFLGWDKPHIYSEQEITLYQVFTNLVPPVVESWRLKQQQRRVLAELFLRLSRRLNLVDDRDELLDILAAELSPAPSRINLTHINADEGEDQAKIQLVATWPPKYMDQEPAGVQLAVTDFPLARLWLTSPEEPLLIADVAAAEQIGPQEKEAATNLFHQAVAFVPLVEAGQWVGGISVSWDERRSFNEEEWPLYRELTGLITPIVRNWRWREGFTAERANLKEQLLNVDEARVSLQKQLDELTAARTQLEQQLEAERTQAEAELAQTREGWEQTQQQLAAMTEAQTQVEAELAETREGWEQTQQQLATMTEERTKAEAELAETMEAWEQTQQQLAAMTEARTQVEAELAQTREEWEQTQQQLAGVTEARTQVEAELVQTREGWTQTQQQLAAMTVERTKAEAELAKTMEAWKQTQQQLAGMTEARTQLQQQLEEEQAKAEAELAETMEAWEQTQQQLAEVTEARVQLQQQLQESEETIGGLRQQLEDERQLAKQQLIDTAQRVIHELPLSIIPLMDQIAVVPLVGPIDATRAKGIMDTLSSRVALFQPKVVFLDITGVPDMNEEVTAHLAEISEVMEAQGVQTTLIGQPVAEL